MPVIQYWTQPPMELNTDERIRQAGEKCAAGLWPEVLAFAQKWQAEDPADHRALYYLGLGWSGLGQHARAEAAYRKSLTMDPTDFKIWHRLSELLYKELQRPAEGVRCLKQALRINPQHQLGWLQLAAMSDDMGSFDQALECAEQALALDPKLVAAYLHKASAAKALGRMDVVQEVCQQLSALKPENFQRAS
jgi:tetratricopeptide (TPR) repeat protein